MKKIALPKVDIFRTLQDQNQVFSTDKLKYVTIEG